MMQYKYIAVVAEVQQALAAMQREAAKPPAESPKRRRIILT